MALRLAVVIALLLLGASGSGGERAEGWASGPMRFGIGDRLTVLSGGEWVSLAERAATAGIRPDYLQVWLTRGWRTSWIPRERLQGLAARGVTPVFVHYFFGDEISRERVTEEREEWHASLRRMARVARHAGSALIVLEPEFNIEPPAGETAIVDWPGFADEIRTALRLIRAEAPHAKIGVCAGDFYPDQNLGVLGTVAAELDFLAFQEMRGSTDPVHTRSGYLRVGWDSVRYARYLRERFGKPILLAYVAVSSHGGWEARQAEALRDLHDARGALREQGVFGMIYFQLQDDPEHAGYFGAAERRFGLIREDGSPKPAFYVFQTLIERPAPTSAETPSRTAIPAKPR